MISQTDIDFYNTNGFLVVPDVLDGTTVKALRAAVEELVAASRAVTGNTALYDLEDDHRPDAPRVRRLKDPDRHHEVFAGLRAHPEVVAVLEALWGTGVRFDKSKLNMKSEGGGAAVEWHQDWAFYPHTNDDLAAVGFMIDDVGEDNGPMMVVPGSHRGPVYDHHSGGYFCGAMDLVRDGIEVAAAVPLTGRAGSITIHHVRAVHGSAPNRSNRPRRFLLHQYCAADAWPVGESLSYERYTENLVCGEPVLSPRMVAVPVRLPYPPAPFQGSIYENQRTLEHAYFKTA
jgi:ectoine hydroxylase-related dioxygenase (phytanoyl-CoA dioxygenase family)